MEPDRPRRRDRFLSLVKRSRTPVKSHTDTPTSPLKQPAETQIPPSTSLLASRNALQSTPPSTQTQTSELVVKVTPKPVSPIPQGTVTVRSSESWESALSNIRHDSQNSKVFSAFQKLVSDPGLESDDVSGVTQTSSQDDRAGATVPAFTEPAAPSAIPNIDWRQILERRSNDARSKMTARSKRLKPIRRILEMIDKAKDGITIATSFEPHAAMAWSCVSFLLPLVSGSLSQKEDAISGLEYISSLMTRYNLHERTYLQPFAGGVSGPSSSNATRTELGLVANQLQKHTTALYEKILLYQLSMACHYARTPLQRYVRNVTMRDDWKGVLEDIKLHESNADFDMQAIDSDRLQSLVTARDDNVRYQILSALSCDYETGKGSHPKAVDGTCTWLLQTPQYQTWLHGDMPFMLLTGCPGSGKSVLLRFIAEHFASDIDMLCCYFFFRESGGNKDSVIRALSAIIHQLCLQSEVQMMSYIKKIWADRGPDLAKNLLLLWQVLIHITSQSSTTVVVILDALDEASADGRSRFMELVNEHYVEAGSSPKLRLLISSRQYYNIDFSLRTLVRGLGNVILDMDEFDLGGEMMTIVQSLTARLDLSDATKSHLLNRLLEKQTNTKTFLWLKVIFEYLTHDIELSNASSARIDYLVDEAPTELDETYERLLERSRDPERARVILNLLLVAAEPFTLRSLQVALRITSRATPSVRPVLAMWQTDKDFELTIVNLCGLFVTVVDERPFLFHGTVREFLIGSVSVSSTPARLWKQTFDPMGSHSVLTKVCTDFYDSEDIEAVMALDTPIREYKTFAEYAAANWIHHYAFGWLEMFHVQKPTNSALEATRSIRRNWSYSILDFARREFWAWYTRSGLSIHQLQFDWTSWIMLLATQTGAATFDRQARVLLLIDEDELQHCRSCGRSNCQSMVQFTCSNYEEFKILFIEHCGSDYEDWLKLGQRERKTHRQKKLASPAFRSPVTAPTFGDRRSVGNLDDMPGADSQADLSDPEHPDHDSLGNLEQSDNQPIASLKVLLETLDELFLTSEWHRRVSIGVYPQHGQSWRSIPCRILNIVKKSPSYQRPQDEDLVPLPDGERVPWTALATYRKSIVLAMSFLEDTVESFIKEYRYDILVGRGHWGGTLPKLRTVISDFIRLSKTVETFTDEMDTLRTALSIGQISEPEELDFPFRRGLDVLAFALSDDLPEFQLEFRARAYSVVWNLRALSVAYSFLIQHFKEGTKPCSDLERAYLDALQDERKIDALRILSAGMWFSFSHLLASNSILTSIEYGNFRRIGVMLDDLLASAVTGVCMSDAAAKSIRSAIRAWKSISALDFR